MAKGSPKVCDDFSQLQTLKFHLVPENVLHKKKRVLPAKKEILIDLNIVLINCLYVHRTSQNSLSHIVLLLLIETWDPEKQHPL